MLARKQALDLHFLLAPWALRDTVILYLPIRTRLCAGRSFVSLRVAGRFVSLHGLATRLHQATHGQFGFVEIVLQVAQVSVDLLGV